MPLFRQYRFSRKKKLPRYCVARLILRYSTPSPKKSAIFFSLTNVSWLLDMRKEVTMKNKTSCILLFWKGPCRTMASSGWQAGTVFQVDMWPGAGFYFFKPQPCHLYEKSRGGIPQKRLACGSTYLWYYQFSKASSHVESNWFVAYVSRLVSPGLSSMAPLGLLLFHAYLCTLLDYSSVITFQNLNPLSYYTRQKKDDDILHTPIKTRATADYPTYTACKDEVRQNPTRLSISQLYYV